MQPWSCPLPCPTPGSCKVSRKLIKTREHLSDGLLGAWAGLPGVHVSDSAGSKGGVACGQSRPYVAIPASRLVSSGRSYSWGRTADWSEAACGLTAPLNFMVRRHCRGWDPTNLRTLAAYRVGLLVHRVLVIMTRVKRMKGLA